MTHTSAIVTAALLWCGAPDAAPANWVQNPGFERGDLEHWRTHTPDGFFRVHAADRHSGRFALVAHGDRAYRYNSFATLVQPLGAAPVPGTQYRLSVRAKTAIRGGGQVSARVTVREVNDAGKTIRYVGPYLRGAGWDLFEFQQAVALPPGTSKVWRVPGRK